MRAILRLAFIFVITVCVVPAAYACNTCGCTVCHLGKNNGSDSGKKWYARFVYDQTVWRAKSAQQQHDLHHQGHEVHDRTRDVMYHYQIGGHITDDLNIMLDIPYMTKESLDVEHHSTLGAREHSKGISDVQLIGEYRFWHNDRHAVGLAGGVKFPAGSTQRKNARGERFETDMQPGTGAHNFIAGGTYRYNAGPFFAAANASQVFTRKGAQEFQYGDLFTASLLLAYELNPQAQLFKTAVGLDTVFQSEWKEKAGGVKNPDSGGQTTFMGPYVRVGILKDTTITGTFLYPVSQDLNGYTQEQAFQWTLGTEVRF